MTSLEDTFGEEFADRVQKRIQESRAEREKISEETAARISALAVNEGRMEEGDPTFTYTTESGVVHNVLLCRLPQINEGTIWNLVNELESGAYSVPLEYPGASYWIWSIFNDPDMAKKMEEGEWYLIVGNLDQYERDDGTMRDQFSPVRGVIPLDEAREWAEKALEADGFTIPDQETDTEEEEEDDDTEVPALSPDDDEEEEDDEDDSTGTIFGADDEDEEEEPEEEETPIDATYSDVAEVVEGLADEEEEVWDVHEDHDELDTFILVVCDRLGLDFDDDQVKQQVTSMALDRVEEGPSDDDLVDEEEESLFG